MIVSTIATKKPIYKIVPINENFLLCGGSNILLILKISDKIEPIIQAKEYVGEIIDITRVNKSGVFALSIYPRNIRFVKVDNEIILYDEYISTKIQLGVLVKYEMISSSIQMVRK